MKKISKIAALALCTVTAVCGLSACAEKLEIIEDPNPYTFVNKDHDEAVPDEGMTIDGKFDEARWQNARWLSVEDKPNSKQSAKIDFTCIIGGKGLYVGLKVEEDGTNIWVNSDRTSWANSCIEMYIGPVGQKDNYHKTMEIDLQADGTLGSNRVNSPTGWRSAQTVWEHMPVVASQTLGGDVNTRGCYGYHVEAFLPYEYFKRAGWDVSDPENLVLGIDPVHIFSLSYDGDDVTQNETDDRYWSRWANKYLPNIGWLEPDKYFHFGSDGLLAHDYTIKYGGSGKGTVTERGGMSYVLQQLDATFTVKPINGAEITKLTVNGADYLDKLSYDGGTAYFIVPKPTEDLDIEINFN